MDVAPHGHRAARTELGQERSLDLDGMARLGVVDTGQRNEGSRIVDPTLDSHTSLADGRHERGDVEALGDAIGQRQDLERGNRHHDGTRVGHLRQTCVDVAAQLDERQVRAHPQQLCSSSHRTGGHGCAMSQIVETATDERVGRVASLAERSDHQTVRERRWQILRRMHSKVGLAVEHCELHLFHEHALPTDHVQWNVEPDIAGGLDHHQLDRATRRRRDPISDCSGLRNRLTRTTSGQPQRCDVAVAAGHGSFIQGRRGHEQPRRCARPAGCPPAT